jgi:hypothetical protein
MAAVRPHLLGLLQESAYYLPPFAGGLNSRLRRFSATPHLHRDRSCRPPRVLLFHLFGFLSFLSVIESSAVRANRTVANRDVHAMGGRRGHFSGIEIY